MTPTRQLAEAEIQALAVAPCAQFSFSPAPKPSFLRETFCINDLQAATTPKTTPRQPRDTPRQSQHFAPQTRDNVAPRP